MKKISTTVALLFFVLISKAADIEELKKQLESSPDNLKLRQTLAQAYFDEGKFSLAVEVLKPKAERLAIESLTLLIQAYEKLGDKPNQGKFLEQLTVNYPKFYQGFKMLGDYYFEASLTKNDPRLSMNSLAAYRAAIGLNSTYRPAYDSLLVAYEKYKNFYELRVLLEDMAKRFGKTSEILANLCRRNTVDGFFVNARKFCREAINADSSNPDNFVYLALIENNEGKIDRADLILKKTTSKFSQSEFANSNYADFLAQQKNLLGAELYFQRATKATPKTFRAQIGLAQTSFDLKHYEAALDAYKEACRLNPHYTYRQLKRSTDLLRHRNEATLEAKYSLAMDKCMPAGGDEVRAPAQANEEFRSPFALFSKNQKNDLIGF